MKTSVSNIFPLCFSTTEKNESIFSFFVIHLQSQQQQANKYTKRSLSSPKMSSIASAEPCHSHKCGIVSGSQEGSEVSLISSVHFLPNPHGFALCPEHDPSSGYFSPDLIRPVRDMHCCCLELQRNY